MTTTFFRILQNNPKLLKAFLVLHKIWFANTNHTMLECRQAIWEANCSRFFSNIKIGYYNLVTRYYQWKINRLDKNLI